MKNAFILFPVCLLLMGGFSAGENIDLSRIEHFCPKGRVQDLEYNTDQPVIHSLIEEGTKCIPLLIEMLNDDTEIDHQIMDYWPINTVGDIALVILTALTTDSIWKASTIPGASWDNILESKPNPGILLPVLNQLYDFKQQYGSKEIKRKWQKIWSDYQEKIYWDSKEKCFKIKPIIDESEMK